MSTTFRMSRSILGSQPYIVVGVDGSPSSRSALRWALREARSRGAAVDAVRVWTDPWDMVGPPSMVGVGARGLAGMRDELARAVDAAADEAEVHDVPVVEQVLAGDPADTLLAESGDALMLVVGTRGLGAVGRFLLGSVSRRCTQLAHVPCVVVPDPERPADRQQARAASSGAR